MWKPQYISQQCSAEIYSLSAEKHQIISYDQIRHYSITAYKSHLRKNENKISMFFPNSSFDPIFSMT